MKGEKRELKGRKEKENRGKGVIRGEEKEREGKLDVVEAGEGRRAETRRKNGRILRWTEVERRAWRSRETAHLAAGPAGVCAPLLRVSDLYSPLETAEGVNTEPQLLPQQNWICVCAHNYSTVTTHRSHVDMESLVSAHREGLDFFLFHFSISHGELNDSDSWLGTFNLIRTNKTDNQYCYQKFYCFKE